MSNFSNLLSGTKVLEERKSPFNGKIQVVRSLGFGIYIQAGGITQSGGVVEEIWRQTLKKVKSEKLKIKSCLILGLGGGSAAKLIRKYWPKAEITGVDIDPAMVELGKKYLGLDKAKVKIIIRNAYKFDKGHYDLILIDLYRGDKFPKKFESERFRSLVHGLLADFGVAIFNRLYYGDKRPEAMKFGEKLEKVFPKVDYFYPQANMMFFCEK
jgi:spermidine synthase